MIKYVIVHETEIHRNSSILLKIAKQPHLLTSSGQEALLWLCIVKVFYSNGHQVYIHSS